jgi:hypothetical protein
VVSDGRTSVVKETAKTESSIQRQERQAHARIAAAVNDIADDAHRGDAAPRDIDVGTRPGGRQVRILSKMLGVVREVQQARRCVQNQEPRQGLTGETCDDRPSHHGWMPAVHVPLRTADPGAVTVVNDQGSHSNGRSGA